MYIAQVFLQVHTASLAEVFAGLAVICIHGHQATIHGAGENPRITRASRPFSPPVGDAAAGGGVGAGQVRPRIVGPALLAGFRVEGDDAAEGRAQIHAVIDHQGRGLEGGGTVCRGPGRQVLDVVGPGHFETIQVVGGDLFEGREALAGSRAAHHRPVGHRPTRLDRLLVAAEQ